MQKRLSIILLSIMLLMVACSDVKLSPIPADSPILAFGDSLTRGKGVELVDSYPSVLARLSGREVINAGISGEVTKAGLQRYASVLDKHRPSLVILLEGGNDILRNNDLRQTKQNLAAMIELTRDRGIAMILVGVPSKSLFSDTAPFYRELAEQYQSELYQLIFADELIADLLRTPAYKSDMVHFNQLGYQKMAEQLHQLLIEHGAL